jgi:hypothetical protein
MRILNMVTSRHPWRRIHAAKIQPHRVAFVVDAARTAGIDDTRRRVPRFPLQSFCLRQKVFPRQSLARLPAIGLKSLQTPPLPEAGGTQDLQLLQEDVKLMSWKQTSSHKPQNFGGLTFCQPPFPQVFWG